MRPFGVSSMLAGFGTDGSPQLYLNDPAGTYSAWKVRRRILLICSQSEGINSMEYYYYHYCRALSYLSSVMDHLHELIAP